MRLSSRRAAVLVCLGLTLATAGCTAEESTENPYIALCADPIVVTCDPDGPVGITIRTEASKDDVERFAGRLQDAVTQTQREVTLHADDPAAVQVDPDVSPVPKWLFTVRPGASVDALGDVLDAASVPGVAGVTASTGWPSAVAATLDDLEPLIASLSSTALFAEGGSFTVSSSSERFRLVYVPAYTTMDGVPGGRVCRSRSSGCRGAPRGALGGPEPADVLRRAPDRRSGDPARRGAERAGDGVREYPRRPAPVRTELAERAGDGVAHGDLRRVPG
ncbi:hypothetical protein [Microbacterium testaceum]|uniref:hypothetical protein n=1 Tax=Microbacterium testaceum TaxID=2033 RepID=UPI0012473BF4|nr:hypothetical protein [Microbacterium testaceum]